MAQRAAPADLVFLPYPRSIERREGEPGCVIDLATRRAIRLPPATTWPIAEINAAFAALREGRVVGKAVVVNQET